MKLTIGLAKASIFDCTVSATFAVLATACATFFSALFAFAENLCHCDFREELTLAINLSDRCPTSTLPIDFTTSLTDFGWRRNLDTCVARRELFGPPGIIDFLEIFENKQTI
ncbi:MAG: hypothetical protein QKV59_gp2 [Avonheates virus SG_19]|uniref:hypothetical protein n=1 Tax=Avonheates virus SG_19 TaxID=2914483 RepID=UPI002481A61B|nr:MAG: hypothetical protein QKV59_gp2 [Avonheates virus SG_19]UNI72608.1 MAG: hypothetical protein [Avonheates virus SG_19]